jgi:hypothetical protein
MVLDREEWGHEKHTHSVQQIKVTNRNVTNTVLAHKLFSEAYFGACI